MFTKYRSLRTDAVVVSLYYVQKLLFLLNRDPQVQARYDTDLDNLLSDFDLTEEEIRAIREPDIGLLYVLGVNGQLLMHYAALHKYEWTEYLEAMREGLRKYGPVREGVYTLKGYEGVEAHDARLRARRARAQTQPKAGA